MARLIQAMESPPRWLDGWERLPVGVGGLGVCFMVAGLVNGADIRGGFFGVVP